MSAGPVSAVVPVKELAAAKRRLAPVLGPEERAQLSLAMLEDVLAALEAVPALAGLAVLTRDPRAAALARRRGARVLHDAGDGLNGALDRAAAGLAAEGCAGVLVVPADVPLASAAEIEALLAALGPAPAVGLAPAHDGRGTNALLRAPALAIPARFGGDSLAAHRAAARAAGIVPRIAELPGLARDLDRPADLRAFAARPSPTHSYALLREAGWLARLGAAFSAQEKVG